MKNLRTAIIGAGKVGTALALDFCRKKLNIAAVIDKNLKKAKELAKQTKAEIYSNKISDIPEEVNLFVIAVQDRFIQDAAKNLAKSFRSLKGKFAFHTSGALTSKELKPLAEKGAKTFSLHPNFSFVSGNLRNQKIVKFIEAVFALESDSKLTIKFAERFCRKMKYDFIHVNSKQKVLYHLFSVIISNYMVTEFYLIEKHFGRQMKKSYLNLLKSTIQNIEKFGITKSLTGPIIRDDFGTIQKHLKILSEINPFLKDIYIKFGKLTIEFIEQRIKKQPSEELKKLFNQA